MLPEVQVVFSEDAQDYLIDHGRSLSRRQRLAIAKMIKELEKDPDVGDPPLFPEYTPCDAWIERHLGSRVHAVFYYDIEKYQDRITIRVRAVRIGMKM